MFIPLKYLASISFLIVLAFVAVLMYSGENHRVDTASTVLPQPDKAVVQSEEKLIVPEKEVVAAVPQSGSIESSNNPIAVLSLPLPKPSGDQATDVSEIDVAQDRSQVESAPTDQSDVVVPTQDIVIIDESEPVAESAPSTDHLSATDPPSEDTFVGEVTYTDGQVTGDVELDLGGPLVEYADEQQMSPQAGESFPAESGGTFEQLPDDGGDLDGEVVFAPQTDSAQSSGPASIQPTIIPVPMQTSHEDVNSGDQAIVPTQSNLPEEVVTDAAEPINETVVPQFDQDLLSLAERDDFGGYTAKDKQFRIYGQIVPYGTAQITFLEDMTGIIGTIFVEVSGVTREGYELGLHHREYLVYPKEQEIHEAYPLSLADFAAQGYIRVTLKVCAEGQFTDDGECYDPNPTTIDEISMIYLDDDPVM